MPHLPQPARSRAVAINRVVRRAAKSPLPEVQAPGMKAPNMKSAVREAAVTSEVEMMASSASEN
jgi:hypothetical protein